MEKKKAQTMALLAFLCRRRDFLSFCFSFVFAVVAVVVSFLCVCVCVLFCFFFGYRLRSKYYKYIFRNLPSVFWR